MLTIEYLSKFGYAIDWDDTVFIIDYTDGRLPSNYLKENKETFFLVSEHTKNHFNESIKVYKKPIISPIDLLIDQELTLISIGDALHFGAFKIKAIGHENNGMGYIISKNDKHVFHTGSLSSRPKDKDTSNLHILETAETYRDLIESLGEKFNIDVLITEVPPLDGYDFDHDARFLVKTLKARKMLPTNFGNFIADINRFATWVRDSKGLEFMGPKHENKKYRIENL